MAHYFDTSALVKLVVVEPETTALRAWIAEADRSPTTSDLTRAELLRAVRRAAPDLMVRARKILDSLTILTLTTSTFEDAGVADPAILRTLDAIHLTAARALGDDLEGMVVYDARLGEAARSAGVAVVAPA
ncbi:MAG: type II toxin-antitoxin system VapC family toxin [Nocardioides sp.]